MLDYEYNSTYFYTIQFSVLTPSVNSYESICTFCVYIVQVNNYRDSDSLLFSTFDSYMHFL